MTIPTYSLTPDDASGKETVRFFTALMAEKPADAHLLVWTFPNKISASFTSVTEAMRYVESMRDKYDVYVGVGLSDTSVQSWKRYGTDQVTGICAFWADIDIADPLHKKGDLPPTVEDGKWIARDTGLAPSLLVHTGHGLQGWWILQEPWMFGAAQREDAKQLVTDWLYSVKARAATRGWGIDSVQDLARVLRVAGTYNRKDASAVVPVRILEENPRARYTLDDIRASVARAPMMPAGKSAGSRIYAVSANASELAKSIVLNPNANQPGDKWARLQQDAPGAAKAFGIGRRVGAATQTPSEEDFLLAVLAAEVSFRRPEDAWTAQEIVDLLIAHRRFMGYDLKLRPDYYARTIEKARAAVTDNEAKYQLEALLDDTEVAELNRGREEAERTRGKLRPKANGQGSSSSSSSSSSAAKITSISAATSSASAAIDLESDSDEADEVDDIEEGWGDFDPDDAVEVPDITPTAIATATQTAASATATTDVASNTITIKGVSYPVPPGTDPKTLRWMAGMAKDQADDAPATGDTSKSGKSGKGKKAKTDEEEADEQQNAELMALPADANREKILATLSSVFKHFTVVKVIKMVATPPMFALVIRLTGADDEVTINFGTVDNIISPRNFRNTLAAYTNVLIEQSKQKAWDVIVRALLKVSEIEDIGDEATDSGLVRAWLDTYIFNLAINRDWDGVPPENCPFIYAQHLHINGRHLAYWLRTNEQEKITPKQLGMMLRSVGCETVTIGYTDADGKRTSRGAWRLPDNIADDHLSPATLTIPDPVPALPTV